MKKSIIKTFNNSTYDIDLIIANQYTTLKDLEKLYNYSDKEDLDNRILEGYATTSIVCRKKDNAICILVKFNGYSKKKGINKHVDLINTCSHEGTHVALDIYEIINQNICFCTPEPFCYLQAWATTCIYTTLTEKK